MEEIIEEEKKRKDKKKFNILLYILIGISLMMISSGIFFLLGQNSCSKCKECSSNSTDKKKTYNQLNVGKIKISASDEKNLTKNITIFKIFHNKKAEYNSSHAYIYGKNNNNQSVSLDMFLEYYDKKGNRIDRAASYATIVKANTEFVVDLLLVDDSISYESATLLYAGKNMPTYNIDIESNKVDVKSSMLEKGVSGKTVVSSITNLSDKSLRGYLGIVYYKNGKEVFALSRSFIDIQPSLSKNIEFYSSYLEYYENGKTQKGIDYDEYRVFLTSAYYSDTKNY